MRSRGHVGVYFPCWKATRGERINSSSRNTYIILLITWHKKSKNILNKNGNLRTWTPCLISSVYILLKIITVTWWWYHNDQTIVMRWRKLVRYRFIHVDIHTRSSKKKTFHPWKCISNIVCETAAMLSSGRWVNLVDVIACYIKTLRAELTLV